MPRPVAHRKPDLTRFQTRQIIVPPTRQLLEGKLQDWMAEVVNSTKHPHAIQRMAPAKYLVMHSEGIDSILQAPAGMRLDPRGVTQTVHARFYFAGMPDGNWYVEHVKFSPRLSDVQRKMAAELTQNEQQEIRKRILERVEAEHRVHPKTLAFKAELHGDTWQDDIALGAKLIQNEIDTVYGHAKKAAYIPDNPYTVKDVAMGGMGKVVGGLGKLEKGAEKFANAYEKTEKAISAYESADKFVKMKEPEKKGDILSKSQDRVFKESKGDLIAEKVIDQAADLPGAGVFVKGFAAMFFHFASANYAGIVTKIRGRAYSWYIAGFVQGLTNVAIERAPKDEIDSYFFNFAFTRAHGFSEQGKFRAQVFLLWYSSQHHVGGDSAGFKITRPDEWTFPDGYLAHWSPERLGLAMAALLKRKEYLVD